MPRWGCVMDVYDEFSIFQAVLDIAVTEARVIIRAHKNQSRLRFKPRSLTKNT